MSANTLDQIDVERKGKSPRSKTPNVPGSELIDSVLLKLQAYQNKKELASLCVGITSPDRGVGVSTIASKLALQAAEHGMGNVLLVDANFVRPCIHKIFRGKKGPGILEHLGKSTDLKECVQATHDPDLQILSWGVDDSDSGVVSPLALQPFFDDLRSRYQLIVFDLPAIDGTGYGLFFASQTDGVIMVVDGNVSRAAHARQLTQLLSENWVEVIGVVLNRYTPSLPQWLRRWF